jgi:hypothetical protein
MLSGCLNSVIPHLFLFFNLYLRFLLLSNHVNTLPKKYKKMSIILNHIFVSLFFYSYKLFIRNTLKKFKTLYKKHFLNLLFVKCTKRTDGSIKIENDNFLWIQLAIKCIRKNRIKKLMYSNMSEHISSTK